MLSKFKQKSLERLNSDPYSFFYESDCKIIIHFHALVSAIQGIVVRVGGKIQSARGNYILVLMLR
jgi:hypothetical protein